MSADLTQQLRDAADSGRFDALDMDLLREAAEQLAAKDADLRFARASITAQGCRCTAHTDDDATCGEDEAAGCAWCQCILPADEPCPARIDDERAS